MVVAPDTCRHAGSEQSAIRPIEQRQQSQIAESMLTLEQHMTELKALREMAKVNGQMSSAVRAEELRGKLCGFYVERGVEHDNASEFDKLTDVELRDFIVSEAQALGIASP